MTAAVVSLVRTEDQTLVDAELVTGLRPAALQQIDQQWLPMRQRIHRSLKQRGVPRSRWPQNGGWDWTAKSRVLQLLAIRGLGLRIGDRWQGAALINVAQYHSRSPDSRGKPLVYLEFIEVAPHNWPSRISGTTPTYSGCGSQMLRQVVFESFDEDYAGRVGLHSLEQSRSFYEYHGMAFIETDAKKGNLAYYEFTRQAAAHFLSCGATS